MPVAPEQTIDAIMAYVKDDLRSKCRFWPRKIRELVGWDACQFFIFVMLDQMQRVERTMAAAKDFIDKRDKRWTPRTFWRNIAQMKLRDVKRYCTFSDKNEHAYNGKYAGYNANKFSGWLRKNARIITERYEVVENIWLKDLPDEPSKKIDELTRRFADFHGIGNNLANMAVSILVRNYGYAGGESSKKFLRIKFDVHVKRVVEKAMLFGTEWQGNSRRYVNKLNEVLDSPAEFDYAAFYIGKNFCMKDKCEECPICEQCNTYLSS